ncbi:MAG TPA: EAL domain-containing protein [Rhodocyclaceae bacterium]|nr:EAL domain-containing protein [Rhodocyclaceae bacterium]
MVRDTVRRRVFASATDMPDEAGNDTIMFAAEIDADVMPIADKGASVWRVLLADDDEEVHRATAFALRGVKIDGVALHLLHAHSAAEAEVLLARHDDIAVAMLDVVMETTDAGLVLVDTIRNRLGLKTLRIVLRTGQPGYAPELEVIERYDINDYRTKSELTQTRLITTLTSAVRAYAQLEHIERTNHGLGEVSRAANTMFRIRSASEFAKQLLAHVGSLLGCPLNGLVCVDLPASPDRTVTGMSVLHAVGDYAGLLGMPLDKIVETDLLRAIQRCVAARSMLFEGGRVFIWMGGGTRDAVSVFDVAGKDISPISRRLLEILAANLTVGFENVDLFERLDFFAFFDPLTHLPNRTRFLSDVDQDLFARSGNSRCLALADVVRFSDINDALGHRCGDTLLIGVSRRLRAAVGPEVSCARISGDVFALFGPENAIDPVAMRRAFESPFFVHGHALSVQVRMGIVRVADSRGSAVELMRSANLALSQARQSGGGAWSYFTRAMSEDVQSRVSMLHSLRAAIDFKRGLSLAYQPLMNARSGEVLGAEALLRWRNDFGESVAPLRFIPLAERTGLINELGLWVIETALDRLARWRAQGLDDMVMSINVSSVQFRAEDFAKQVKRLIDLCDVPAAAVTLEITESIALEGHVHVMEQIEDLRRFGVRFAIDDFGTGFSSLGQIALLPADQLKIDRAFVDKVCNSSADHSLAATVVMLAQGRSLDMTAEGVETEDQKDALLALGCERMQGYLFARPMSAEQFDTWLRERPVMH